MLCQIGVRIVFIDNVIVRYRSRQNQCSMGKEGGRGNALDTKSECRTWRADNPGQLASDFRKRDAGQQNPRSALHTACFRLRTSHTLQRLSAEQRINPAVTGRLTPPDTEGATAAVEVKVFGKVGGTFKEVTISGMDYELEHDQTYYILVIVTAAGTGNVEIVAYN